MICSQPCRSPSVALTRMPAVYYLGRLLVAGDLLSPCRRLLVIASEDIGLAYPQAMAITKACVDAAVQLGLPGGQASPGGGGGAAGHGT